MLASTLHKFVWVFGGSVTQKIFGRQQDHKKQIEATVFNELWLEW